ncbi:MAG: site-specific integrase [Opitutales bacterium]|nr:site-specific integrase [Opitutales bacterium]
MGKKSEAPGLVLRGRVWAIRLRVPGDLVAFLKKRELGYSLRTKDRKEALLRYAVEESKIQREFAKARRDMAKAGASPTPGKETTSHIVDKLSPARVEYLALLWFHNEERKSAEGDLRFLREHGEAYAKDQAGDLGMDINSIREELQGHGPYEEGSYANGSVQETLDKFLEAQDIRPGNPNADWVRQLKSLLARAMIESLERSIQRLNGNPFPECQDRFFRHVNENVEPPEPVENDLVQGPSITKLLESYLEEKRPSMDAKDLYQRVVRWFVQVCEDKPVIQYVREDCIAFRNALERTPARSPVMLTQEKTKERSRRSDRAGKPRSQKSVNNALSTLSALFKYAEQNNLIHFSPAGGLVKKDKFDDDSSKRKPFELEDLRRLFSAPFFAEYANRKDTEPLRHWPFPNATFWVPLISLYSGMRLNEICQLYTEDVETLEGIPCFQVRLEDAQGQRTEDKRLKTKHSRRTIPIHRELLALGFAEYVEGRKTAGARRLFEEVPMSSKGRYSDSFQKRFRRLLDSLDMKDPLKTFHSFRHTFRDALRAAGVTTEITNVLCGWKESEGLAAYYGNGYQMSTRNRAVKQVDYPGLGLKMLWK